jgi:hypothetical protein
MLKQTIKRLPILRSVAKYVINKLRPFHGSADYWEQRYKSGGDSGAGSYRQLAEFKAQLLNDFVKTNHITTVIEYGSGDGNQLQLADYPAYTGFDVSPSAIQRCQMLFKNDPTKSFKLMTDYAGERAQLTLSLDVIYHLVEDAVFNAHMQLLFDSAERFVIVYASNFEESAQARINLHVRHRKFTDWVETARPQWKLLSHIPNAYPYSGDNDTGSLADFYIYRLG